ncbi:MAG: 4-(cytidine 5'-diphospho)-2-C-methyl-D-erythritol kinase [Clostridia bacterium]|nr:4-(cytidine 5'-diphospho)-2-C-methyl-D-erythritol kinase [Clostridia bacterium]
MNEAVIDACAKLNLTLNILGRRADGFHELETVMQSVTLCDTVTVRLTQSGVTAQTDCALLEAGGENLAQRAAERFFEYAGLRCGAQITIKKRIPLSAGLAGGSADAAAVLTALSLLTGAPLSHEELAKAAATLGADVPFCLSGGTALCRGVGEKITAVPAMPTCPIVLAKSGEKASTAQAYAEYDRRGAAAAADNGAMIEALAGGDLRQIGALLRNAFEGLTMYEAVMPIRDTMLRCGAAGAAMTGSGPAVFGLFENEADAQSCLAKLGRQGVRASLCRPAATGCIVKNIG